VRALAHASPSPWPRAGGDLDFAGGTTDEHSLESDSGTGFEEAGQTITGILMGEEKVAANSVV
jgi:hypothetical protein